MSKHNPQTHCLLCGKECEHLGSHIYHAHSFTAREYKKEYELPYKMPLISPRVKEKKQEAYAKDRERYLKNLLDAGGKYRYKKGHTNAGFRLSSYAKKRAIEQIQAINNKKKGKSEQCPICKTYFDHIESHLYNKHGLLKVIKNEYRKQNHTTITKPFGNY